MSPLRPNNGIPKWILYKHTCDLEIIKESAWLVKNSGSAYLGKDSATQLLQDLRAKGLYRGRGKNQSLDSGVHRINTLVWYMLGYKHGVGKEKKFIFSPLGNLFIKHIQDDEKLSYVCLSMLWGKQFPDGQFGTPDDFRIYPFRLIFQLLLDSRLSFSLGSLEYAHVVSKVTSIDDELFEKLIVEILEFRAKEFDEKITIAQSEEHHFVNAYHEWAYTINLLETLGVVNASDSDQATFKLHHGSSTIRTIKDFSVSLPTKLGPFLERLRVEHPYNDIPVLVDDPERLKVDSLKEIYAFCPTALLEELGGDIDRSAFSIATLPKRISELSLNSKPGDPDRFEIELANAMNHFDDVVAERISGPGNTDVECLYLKLSEKFALEAKSTSGKLTGLNAGRLRVHREKISAQYTLVISPRYSPSVLTDIKGDSVAILLVSTFSEYLYNAHSMGRTELVFEPIRDILINNLGSDISQKVSALTFTKFGKSLPEGEAL